MFGLDGDELLHIGVSMVVVAVAFSVGALVQSKDAFLATFPIILVGVGSGFVFHELAHKFVAQRYGAYARYQIWESGLALSLLMAVFTAGRFVFAAPGAVYIYSPRITRSQNGIISIAGPLTNLAIGTLFLVSAPFASIGYLQTMAFSAASINFFLGFFNMLPIPPLDGSKVFAWNFAAWAVLIILLAIPTFFLF